MIRIRTFGSLFLLPLVVLAACVDGAKNDAPVSTRSGDTSMPGCTDDAATPSSPTSPTTPSSPVDTPYPLMFDDFAYASPDDAGFVEDWKASNYAPAAPGLGSFTKRNVSFLSDADDAKNPFMQIRFVTAGSRETTEEGEVEGAKRSFLYGTYATRMRYYDQPIDGPKQVVGPDSGDHMVATFFTISPYYIPNTEYGELDFEYLPNAGWNGDGPRFTGPTMWNTTWKTRDVRVTKPTAQDFAGWHVLWMTVTPTAVSYYCDDTLLVTHIDQEYIPKHEMLVLWNLWLTGEQFAQGQNGTKRTWAEDVDWFFHAKDRTMTRADVQNVIDGYRSAGTKKVNTMPPPPPKPASAG